jgi:5-methyltetrahydrofolate--homocysteine methyltransferase
MKTVIVSAQGKEVIVGDNLPTVLIGERINPFRKGPIKEGMLTGNMEPIAKMAVQQVEDGADLLIISVAAFGIDEAAILPEATKAVMMVVDVPLVLESRNPEALEKALQLGCGKPVVSSTTGEDAILDDLLPIVRKYDTSLVALANDAGGIPKTPEERVGVVKMIIAKCEKAGIGREKLLVDAVAESSAVSDTAVLTTLETMKRLRGELDVNLTLGASNVSFGLPNRPVINAVFLALAVSAGLNTAIVNAATMKPYIMAADLMMGHDPKARRYTTYQRKIARKAV